jgi:hypothetical protein
MFLIFFFFRRSGDKPGDDGDDSLSARFSMPPPSVRPKLSLPKPRVSDDELALVQRLARAGGDIARLAGQGGAAGLVSGAGMADALPTPVRPRSSTAMDLAHEALQLARDSEAPTPLAAGVAPSPVVRERKKC